MFKIDVGNDPIDFVRQNIGPNKNPIIIQDEFFKLELGIELVSVMNELEALDIPHQKIKSENRTYLMIADDRKKIEQYLDSEKEDEFQATVLELTTGS